MHRRRPLVLLAVAALSVPGLVTSASAADRAAPVAAAVGAPLPTPTADGTPHDVHVRRALLPGQADDGVRAATIARDVTAAADVYYSESTAGALRLRVASQGNPATRAPRVTGCGPHELHTVAQWASGIVGAARGSRREPVVLYTPALRGCDRQVLTADDLGVTWVIGRGETDTRRLAVTRGVGQALGLGSSDAQLCGPYWTGDDPEGCHAAHGADAYDVLGDGHGPLNGAHLDVLGLLDEDNSVRPTGAAEVELQPVGGLEGRRFLVLPEDRTVYVEYRGAVGRDADLAEGRVRCPFDPGTCRFGPEVEFTAGVVIRHAQPIARWAASSMLVDARDEEPAREPGDPLIVLEPGRSWVSPTGAWRLTTVGVGATATVRVEPHLPPFPYASFASDRWHDGTHWTRSSTVPVSWTAADVPHLEGFQVLVDGVVRAEVGREARSARVPLDEGRHVVVVRAVGNGRTQDGQELPVVRDSVAPRFSPLPRWELGTGAVSTSRVPGALRWGATDDNEVLATVLREPVYRVLKGRTSYPVTARAGVNEYRLSVLDVAGNDTSVSFERSVEVRGEGIATRTGTWSRVSDGDLLHGAALRSTTAGSSLTLTTTARSIGFVGVTGPEAGRATVYVDGVRAGVVDLRSSGTGSRLVWARNWVHPGQHTVRVVVEGTAGRPAVVADGFVVQR